jgi:hypothetical protein
MTTPGEPHDRVDLGKSVPPPGADPTYVYQPGYPTGPQHPAGGGYDCPPAGGQPGPYQGSAPGAYPAYPPPPGAQYGSAQYGYPPPPGVPFSGRPTEVPVLSIISFSCLAATLLSVVFFCGLPIVLTGPAGITLGIVGHVKGESLGKWAAIANGVVLALAIVLAVLFFGFLSAAGST